VIPRDEPHEKRRMKARCSKLRSTSMRNMPALPSVFSPTHSTGFSLIS
jgi:hypothetical protein